MTLSDQIAVALKAEATRPGATRGTCAGLYAVAIASGAGREVDYWLPINEALSDRFGKDGMIRVKEIAWKIYNSASSAFVHQYPKKKSAAPERKPRHTPQQ